MDLEDILFASGSKNLSGIKTKAYWCKKSDILTWPTLADPGTVLADLVTYVNNFVMNTGKYFREFYTTLEAGKLECDREGPTDHGGWRNKATLAFPRNDATSLGAVAIATNGEFVIIVNEPATGKNRVIGNDYCTGARVMEAKSHSGAALTESKGIVVTFYDVANEPSPIYDGLIDIEGDS